MTISALCAIVTTNITNEVYCIFHNGKVLLFQMSCGVFVEIIVGWIMLIVLHWPRPLRMQDSPLTLFVGLVDCLFDFIQNPKKTQ